MPQVKTYPILIVDDDSEIHSIVGLMLDFWGFKSLKAFDAYQAVSQALKEIPILIILDINIPGISGFQTLKLFKSIETTKNIPVIILSGILDKAVINETRKLGAVGYISKPFSHEAFFDKIIEFIPRNVIEELDLKPFNSK